MLVRALTLALALTTTVAIDSCAAQPNSALASPRPSPTLTQADQDLLAQLGQLQFQLYDTPVLVGSDVFNYPGVGSERKTLDLLYSEIIVDEWNAVTFDPASGSCGEAATNLSVTRCAFLATSPHGHSVYGRVPNGSHGSAPITDFVFFKLGSTGFRIEAFDQPTSVADALAVVDAMTPATPAQLVARTQEARDLRHRLEVTAASRVGFKTYLPQQNVENFTPDTRVLSNSLDPFHPFVSLHFKRAEVGNQAWEFVTYEFRDDTSLSVAHCGVLNPEHAAPASQCTLRFRTPKGADVYSASSSIERTSRFDRGSTRLVIVEDTNVDPLNQDELAQFIDSFAEVPSTVIR
jgi:hypothetical protein